jgi:4-hydroxybenzoate polyprenyltransferase
VFSAEPILIHNRGRKDIFPISMQAEESGTDAHAEAVPSGTKNPGWFCRVREWAEMVKIEHTVFALPFALSGLLLGADKLPPALIWFWTVVAFAAARAAAMTVNRLIDSQIDALNPRTSNRAIPAGRIKSSQALFFALTAFAIMIYAACRLPPLCLWLSPLAVGWLVFYSYTKRFTWLCHIALGIALGGAALGGWIAAGGQLACIYPWLLFAAVTSWVAGFDVIYALQDLDFDRKQRLQSIPARFGIVAALAWSKALHLVTLCSLIILGVLMNLGAAYWLGASLVGIMLKYEHSLLKPHDLSRVNAAFFNMNGLVSIATFAAILADRLLR